MFLLLDNFDSFTYNLYDYLAQAGAKVKVVRNDTPLSIIKKQDYQGLIISPGPETPERAGSLMEVLAYYHHRIPIFGICLGHQAIASFFGSNLYKATPMHGKISQIHCQQNPLFAHTPPVFEAVRYNSWLADESANALDYIAHSEKGELMALAHKTLPIWGVQFHPEAALTQYGMTLIRNWLLSAHNLKNPVGIKPQ
ncbi:MAG: aminodeoxychorismate/anthranilate synthase component II [Bernardetiaceae bacterium]|nr:aminodeoxychorismate/anthranilate synthase component II [Bernardetiaceae bacterium]